MSASSLWAVTFPPLGTYRTVARFSALPINAGATLVIPHGLGIPAPIPQTCKVAVAVNQVDNAPQSGCFVSLVDATDVHVVNGDVAPHVVDVEIAAFLPWLSVVEVPPGIALFRSAPGVGVMRGGGSAAINLDLRWVRGGPPEPAGVVLLQPGGPVAAPGWWMRVQDPPQSEPIVVFNDLAGAIPDPVDVGGAIAHTVQACDDGGPNVLGFQAGPIVLPGGGVASYVHNLQEAGIAVQPDLSFVVVVGGPGGANTPLTAPIALWRSASDAAKVEFQNAGAPGVGDLTVYLQGFYLWSGGRVA